jgi:prepilin-type N-terminal cleavage/methylation domain-containing protein
MRKGFTLVEVLVIMMLIAVLSLVAAPSLKKNMAVSDNELAKAKLQELAQAARMYNEDAARSGEMPVAGSFGAPVGFCKEGDPEHRPCVDPCKLFSNDDEVVYLKNQYSWGEGSCGGAYGFKGYNYFVCNPLTTSNIYQPAPSYQAGSGGCKHANCKDNGCVAVMQLSGAGRFGEGNVIAWVTQTGEIKDNYVRSNPVSP